MKTGKPHPRIDRRVYLAHCIYCRADECETRLTVERNGITGAVTVWCADVAACRARHDRAHGDRP